MVLALVGILESSYHYLVRLQRVQRCLGFQQPPSRVWEEGEDIVALSSWDGMGLS